MVKWQYGTLSDGRKVTGYTMKNKNGLEMRCINYGCRITHIILPTKQKATDIVLGFDDIAGYEYDATVMNSFMGSFVGRVANRIGNAEFTLNGKHYNILRNIGQHYLHGTVDEHVFNVNEKGENCIEFTTVSPDSEDGFPGEVAISVTYTLNDDNELVIDYNAVPNADTYLNLTNHSYFNLAGGGTIYEHTLMMNCDEFLEVGEGSVVNGRFLNVENSAFDFRQAKHIGRDINKYDPILEAAGGYDQAFVVNKLIPNELSFVAMCKDEKSGNSLHVYATNPSVQLYTANALDGTVTGKNGLPLLHRGAFCLETQHYPNSPNIKAFSGALVHNGEEYKQSTIYKFGWKE